MKKRYIVLIIIVILLIGLRLALPTIAENYINNKLDEVEGYDASIDDVSMQLYRGAFQIKGFRASDAASKDTSLALFKLPLLDLNISWGALINGEYEGEIYIDSPVLNISKVKDDKTAEPPDDEESFIESFKKMNPIHLNKLEVENATISYRNPHSDPQINLSMKNIHVLVTDVSNVHDPDTALPTSIEIQGNAMGEGSVNINSQLNMLTEIPNFDLSVKIENVEMTEFNRLSKAHISLPIEAGKLFFYSEGVGKGGNIDGYVKPAMVNLTVTSDSTDSSRKFTTKVYNSAVQGTTNLMEDGDKNQVATRIKISGSFANAETQTFDAVLNIFRNAFIEAYDRELDNLLNFNSK